MMHLRFMCVARLLLILSLCGFFMAVTFSIRTAADINSVEWIGQSPIVEKLSNISVEEYNKTKNIACEQTMSHKKMVVNGWNSYIGDSSYSGCFVPLLDGYADMSNIEVLLYGNKYNYVLSNEGVNRAMASDYAMYPVANTNHMAFVGYGYSNSFLYIASDYRKTFSNIQRNYETNIFLVRNNDFDFTLKNAQGTKALVSSGTIAYSSNGRWMIVSANDSAWLRVNIDSGNYEILPFAAAQPNGGYATAQTISNDGRFVAIYRPNDSLKVYDLDKCQSSTSVLASRNCQTFTMNYDAIQAMFQSQQAHFKGLHFTSNGKLRAYASISRNGAWEYAKYQISVPETEPPMRYIALGDSFSSGEGIFNYIGDTNFYNANNEYNLCHLSGSSYPYLLNASISSTLFASVACSGAVSNDVVSRTGDSDFINKLSQAQVGLYDAEDARRYVLFAASNAHPGYIPQTSMIKYYSPTILTITIGGNDIGFGSIIANCIMQPGCFSARDDRERKADEISSKILGMSAKLRIIRQSMAGSNPRLYVLGYPKITSSENIACSLIGQVERERADALVDYLNEAIKIAARNAGATFIDLSNAFIDYTNNRDHRICGDATLAVNGFVSAGSAQSRQSVVRPNNIFGAESYHPNELGHSLLASTIRTLTNNFQLSTSYSTGSGVTIPENFYRRFVGDNDDRVGISAQYVYMAQYESVQRGNSLKLQIEQNSLLVPSSNGQATIELHSEPIVLGTALFNPTIGIDALVVIPPTILAGWHELHLLYTDLHGTNVDIYRYLYVTASDNDYDGDGVLNKDETCLIGGVLGLDEDEDGVDDACDSQIKKVDLGSQRPSDVDNNSEEELFISSLFPAGTSEGVPRDLKVKPVNFDDNSNAYARQPLTNNDSFAAVLADTIYTTPEIHQTKQVHSSSSWWGQPTFVISGIIAGLGVIFLGIIGRR